MVYGNVYGKGLYRPKNELFECLLELYLHIYLDIFLSVENLQRNF